MKRTAATILLFITLLALAVTIAPLSSPAQADDPNQAGLVVDFGNDSVFTSCIEFDEEQLTGCDFLEASGLGAVFSDEYGYGQAVCEINEVGCPRNDCFCDCQGADCTYWAYYHLGSGGWQYSTEGCSSYTVQDGDVEGWAWGEGDYGSTGAKPDLYSFEDLCQEPTVSFTVDPQTIVSGQCAELEWFVEDADFVVLDGEGVEFLDTRKVCPTGTQTYKLRVANLAGEFDYQVTLNVTQATSTRAPTSTPTRVRTPTATRRPTNTPPRAVNTPTPTQQAASVPPSPTPSSIALGLPGWQLGTPAATPTDSPTVVAMALPPVDEPVAPPPEEAALVEPSPSEGVTLDRILLLIGVGAGTLGFGGLAFVGIILILFVVYLRARVLFRGD